MSLTDDKIEIRTLRFTIKPKYQKFRQVIECGYPIKQISYKGAPCHELRFIVCNKIAATFSGGETVFKADAIRKQAAENPYINFDDDCPIRKFILQRLGKAMEDQMINLPVLYFWEMKIDFFLVETPQNDVEISLDVEYFIVTYMQHDRAIPVWQLS